MKASTEETANDPNEHGLQFMQVQRLTGAQFGVLSLRHGTPRYHYVDLYNPSCTCEDWQYNLDDKEVCDHLWKVMLVSDSNEELLTASQSAPTADKAESPAPEPEPTAEPAAPSHEDSDMSLTERVEEWMGDYVRHSQHVHAEDRDHGGTFGVALEIDYQSINETQKEQIKEDLKSVDGVQHHTGFLDEGCQHCDSDDDDYWMHYPEAVVRGLP